MTAEKIEQNVTLEQLIDSYEKLLVVKADLKKQLFDLEEALKDGENKICKKMAEQDLATIAYNGYTYTPGVQHKWYLKSEADCIEQGIEDRFAPFEQDEVLNILVKKDISWRSLQSALKELEESESGIPEEVLQVLNVSDEFGISRRKKDTKGLNKVKQALNSKKEG